MFDFNHWLNRFPGTNFHELNLDWLVEAVKALALEIKDFEIVNQFTYEGDWDITKQYKKFAIVTVNGTEGYISLQSVPAGVQIDNTDYWVIIADYTAVMAGLGARVTAIENYIPQIDARISNNTWLDGKKVVWYGDSWGTTTDNVVDTFHARYPNVDITNRCIGGTTMVRLDEGEFPGFGSNSGYQRIRNESLAGFDYIFIMYGVNDWQHNRPIRTASPDEYEWNYAIEETIKYLQSNHPMVKPVFIFESHCYKTFGSGDDNAINWSGCSQAAYINNAIDICRKYNVDYINLYELMPVDSINVTDYMRNDSGVYIHPKAVLSDLIAECIFQGHLNTGKVYGDDWSSNIILDQVPAVTCTLAELASPISGVPSYPMVKINGNNIRSMSRCNVTTETVIVHVTGYKDDTSTVGIYIRQEDYGQTPVTGGITNINKKGCFDFYVKVPRADKIGVNLLTGTSAILYGLEARIMAQAGTAGSVYNDIESDNVNITVTKQQPAEIRNGYATIPDIQFNCSSTVSSYNNILKGFPFGPSGEEQYLIGYDMTTLAPQVFYILDGVLKNVGQVVTSHDYLIPAFTFKMPY